MSQDQYTLLRSDLHDGDLTGVSVEKEDSAERYFYALTLECISDQGERSTIRVPKVEYLRVSNFLQGNIIFEFRVYEASQCTPELIYKASNSESSYDLDRATRQLEKMRHDDCILLELVSSYGCELAAIACCSIEDITSEIISNV